LGQNCGHGFHPARALTDSTFWLAFFTVAAIIIVTGAVTVADRGRV
jgi:hypothetical protein